MKEKLTLLSSKSPSAVTESKQAVDQDIGRVDYSLFENGSISRNSAENVGQLKFGNRSILSSRLFGLIPSLTDNGLCIGNELRVSSNLSFDSIDHLVYRVLLTVGETSIQCGQKSV